MTKYMLLFRYTYYGDKMKIKVFDESHEKDLEEAVNQFLSSLKGELMDIKYQVAIGISGEDQIYCYSALVLYR